MSESRKAGFPGAGRQIRPRVARPPRGRGRLPWYGPGLLWMVSSVGSGSVLFTPRVGSRYGYELLWAVFLVAFLTWVIIREIGRYTVVSGRTILEGYHDLPGPRGWAVWLIFLPGLVSGVVVVAGIAALVGSVLVIALPGGQAPYAVGLILLSAALVANGYYKMIEKVTAVMAAVLVLSTFATAMAVFPGWDAYAKGLRPALPQDFDPYFLLPWIGFLLAGAAGMMWYSYWVAARGFGGDAPDGEADADTDPAGRRDNDGEAAPWLRSWVRVMGATAAVGVVGATLVNLSFLTLGAELLRPRGIVPQGVRVAEDIIRLLSEVWGPAGMWLLVTGIFMALWGSILANQDGWSRMYADATLMLLRRTARPGQTGQDGAPPPLSRSRLRGAYLLAALTALPILVFLPLRDPVSILSLGGIISAAHLPVVVTLTLALNLRNLPRELGPGPVWSAATVVAIAFYSLFSGVYFLGLFR